MGNRKCQFRCLFVIFCLAQKSHSEDTEKCQSYSLEPFIPNDTSAFCSYDVLAMRKDCLVLTSVQYDGFCLKDAQRVIKLLNRQATKKEMPEKGIIWFFF